MCWRTFDHRVPCNEQQLPRDNTLKNLQNNSPDTNGLDYPVQIFKALGDENRLRILSLLRHGELCVCDIMDVLKLPQSTASRHLAYLRNAGWVNSRRGGKWMYYRLRIEPQNEAIRSCVVSYLSSLPPLQADHLALETHLDKKNKEACK